eukprot:CAMPEP_0181135308 /NCGR_PEP_ID=MMETSP1071-20121207/32552_1 /TAXON_ID=35127 /ORGANISM="Thalassiosira sp., Strain NH16" /LENGTH=747 /DNA_ID=CAMNT_0023221885 /DNA_START=359 /DNA_END=2598 /DNA_ORIENTATION=-
MAENANANDVGRVSQRRGSYRGSGRGGGRRGSNDDDNAASCAMSSSSSRDNGYRVSRMTIPPFRGTAVSYREGDDAPSSPGSPSLGRDSQRIERGGGGSVASSMNSRASLLREVDFDPPSKQQQHQQQRDLESSSCSRSEDSDDNDSDSDDMLDDSSKSSLGVHSSFVRSQIRKQVDRGNWNASIAALPAAPPVLRRVSSHGSLEGTNDTVGNGGGGGGILRSDPPPCGVDGIVRARTLDYGMVVVGGDRFFGEGDVAAANKDFEKMNERDDDSGRPMASIDARFDRDDANSGSAMCDYMGDDSFGEGRPSDANIEPTERELSAAGIDLEELNDNNIRDGDNPLDNNRNADDMGRSKSDSSSPARFRRRTEGDNSQSSSADSMPLDSKDDSAVVNVNDLPELRSSCGAPTTTLFKHSSVKRCLSSTSLVNMLMIQPICEHNELHDDIRGYNLEETVHSMGMESGDDISAFTNGNDNIVENVISVGIDDNDGNDIEEHDDDDDDGTISISEHSLAEMQNGDVMGGFLPSFNNRPVKVDIEMEAPVVTLSVMMAKSESLHRSEAEDSSTFYLHSMQSAESITHVSDAPDYDYYSISTEEDTVAEYERLRNGRVRSKEGESGMDTTTATTTAATKAAAKSGKSTEPTNNNASATKEANHDIVQDNSPPKEMAKSNSAARRLNREVCGILGLPEDDIRKGVRGNIMSRDTELRLRSMVHKKDKGRAGSVGGGDDVAREHTNDKNDRRKTYP